MKTLALLDVCHSDYFTGYHKPVLAVPVFGTMNNREVSEAIQGELNQVYEYFINEHNRTEALLVDHFCAELLTKPEEIYIEQSSDEIPGEDDDCMYMYFGIIKPVFRYGLTWLNS